MMVPGVPGASGVPIGTVLMYAGPLTTTHDAGTQNAGVHINQIRANLAAAGWLYCDGSALAIGDHLLLYGVIGKAFGGDEKQFHVPDLRGRFVRGVSGDAPERDPDVGDRTVSYTGGNTGNTVGSLQDDRLQGHEHNYVSVDQTVPFTLGPGEELSVGINSKAITTSEVTQDPDGKPRISSETRPVNLYMNYIIRFR